MRAELSSKVVKTQSRNRGGADVLVPGTVHISNGASLCKSRSAQIRLFISELAAGEDDRAPTFARRTGQCYIFSVQSTGVIPVKSERQAMDWSLVLVSQGIESTIARVPDSERWQLCVPSNDYARAVQALRQYHVENKHSNWVRELPAGLLLDWRAIAWTLIMLVIYFANAASGDAWQHAGLMNNRLVHAGEWWRLFTAMTLHGDVAHLAINITTGFVLVGLAMGAYGPGLGLLASCLAGLGGNLAGLMVYSQTHQSLGASGIVMGALGAIAVQSVGLTRGATRDIILRALCGGFLLLVLLGLSPDPRTDIIAHVGGFGSGVLLGLGLSLNRERLRPAVDHVALGLFAVLILVTWALALS